MRILGIETTCDETASSVVEDGAKILSNVVFSQVSIHRKFHGVVPELASRAHMEKISAVIKEALQTAEDGKMGRWENGRGKKKFIDAVAFARGPGLPGALLVGRVAAETMSRILKVPIVGVNHLEGHLLACELSSDGSASLSAEGGPAALLGGNNSLAGPSKGKRLQFPLISLIVSGGHTELWLVRGYGRYQILGRTRDDAAGEAFDKVAKLLGLEYPGGPSVEKAGAAGDPEAVDFPRPYLPGTMDFSFSGLKTAVAYHLRDTGYAVDAGKMPFKRKADICASFQAAVVDTLCGKAVDAAVKYKVSRIVVGGGVAANSLLRNKMGALGRERGLGVIFVQKKLCSDNAAMIALAAHRMLESGCRNIPVDIAPELETGNWL